MILNYGKAIIGTYTYKVEIFENPLKTGKASEGLSSQDYVTPVKDSEGDYKLNINGYMKTQEINGRTENEKVQLEVKYMEEYLDYQKIAFRIKNKTDEQVDLNLKKLEDTIYVTTAEGEKVSAEINEMPEEDLVLEPQELQESIITFKNPYKTNLRNIWIKSIDLKIGN